jgi:hypothetical protein
MGLLISSMKNWTYSYFDVIRINATGSRSGVSRDTRWGKSMLENAIIQNTR